MRPSTETMIGGRSDRTKPPTPVDYKPLSMKAINSRVTMKDAIISTIVFAIAPAQTLGLIILLLSIIVCAVIFVSSLLQL